MVHAAILMRDWSATDRLGNHVERYLDPVPVDVLVEPGSTDDMDASRPEGMRVDLTLHFPSSWEGDLRGAKVVLGGRWAGEYRVVGNPMPYEPQLVPRTFGHLAMRAGVQRYDG